MDCWTLPATRRAASYRAGFGHRRLPFPSVCETLRRDTSSIWGYGRGTNDRWRRGQSAASGGSAFWRILALTSASHSCQLARYARASLRASCRLIPPASQLARRLWVIRVGLTLSPLLPVYPNERTSRDRPGWSVLCQRTKSLRSSPLRGSKSREAGSRSRGQRWRGGKVNTISSCIVGVQRMIKKQQGSSGRPAP